MRIFTTQYDTAFIVYIVTAGCRSIDRRAILYFPCYCSIDCLYMAAEVFTQYKGAGLPCNGRSKIVGKILLRLRRKKQCFCCTSITQSAKTPLFHLRARVQTNMPMAFTNLCETTQTHTQVRAQMSCCRVRHTYVLLLGYTNYRATG